MHACKALRLPTFWLIPGTRNLCNYDSTHQWYQRRLCSRLRIVDKECGILAILTSLRLVVSSSIILTVTALSHALAHLAHLALPAIKARGLPCRVLIAVPRHDVMTIASNA